MAASTRVVIPNLGTDEAVEVIEVLVGAGDRVKAEQPLIVLESDKASMEIPSPIAGQIEKLTVAKGDQVKEGDEIGFIVVADAAPNRAKQQAAAPASPDLAKPQPVEQEEATEREDATKQEGRAEEEEVMVNIPDLGTDEAVAIIEVHCKEGQTVAKDDVLIVLESDKASMEIPAPHAGQILSLKCKKGDQVKSGDPLALMLAKRASPAPSPSATPSPVAPAAVGSTAASAPPTPSAATLAQPPAAPTGGVFYAGPAVRRLAREFGVDLRQIRGSGVRGRILKEDVQLYVRGALRRGEAGLPAPPTVDFAQFGKTQSIAMTRMQKTIAQNMRGAWLNIPHVAQFEDADITDLDAWRKEHKAEAEQKGVKLSPVPFLIKALALALRELPQFNVSIRGDELVHKHYYHIGMAVDTPNGLVVPVLRNVDQKSIWTIAAEASALASRARNRSLKREDMQGGCITLSNLGNLGGTQFTPIINPPEVAILGASKMVYRPVYTDGKFVPRLILPLALSYDHRAVNGVDGAKFTSFIARVLRDVSQLTA